MVQDKTFYFIKNEYFIDFPDKNLMQNHEKVNNILHDRPCFFALKDKHNNEIYWMIPVSSKTEKYQLIYEKKLEKYNSCDTIAFGEILGQKRTFLLQNICPVTEKYLREQYKNNNKTVRIAKNLEKELSIKAAKIIALVNKNKKVVFPDVRKIKQELINQLEQEKKQQAQLKPKPIRRGGRVSPMQFPPSTRQPLAPIKRKTVKPKQPAAEDVQQVQPRPKTKRKLVLEPKPNTDDRYRGR